MWFKNATVYRISQRSAHVHDAMLAEAMDKRRFSPVQGLDTESRGWVPCSTGDLLYAQNGNLLLTLRIEKKLLPSAVVKEAAAKRLREIEEREGYKPGRKQQREIKDQVITELLPKAFALASEVRGWIDTVNGWLVVDTVSVTKADAFVSELIRTLDGLTLETLYVARPIAYELTQWLSAVETYMPPEFDLESECVLADTGSDGGRVKYTKHRLEGSDIQLHLEQGKKVTQLAVTWRDKISLVLTDKVVLRRIKPLDILEERAEQLVSLDADRFDSDFALMTGELTALMGDLIAAFGGVRVVKDPT